MKYKFTNLMINLIMYKNEMDLIQLMTFMYYRLLLKATTMR